MTGHCLRWLLSPSMSFWMSTSSLFTAVFWRNVIFGCLCGGERGASLGSTDLGTRVFFWLSNHQEHNNAANIIREPLFLTQGFHTDRRDPRGGNPGFFSFAVPPPTHLDLARFHILRSSRHCLCPAKESKGWKNWPVPCAFAHTSSQRYPGTFLPPLLLVPSWADTTHF